MYEADTMVISGVQPADGRHQGGVEADLLEGLAAAPAAVASSPSSMRPPGKLTWPWCVRRSVERRVRTTLVSPSSSKSGGQHAGVDPA